MEANLASRNPALAAKIHQLSLPLAPLVQLTTGKTHPAYPRTLLSFWCLTSDQLDELAHFYHQRTPCVWTRHYPCPVVWDRNASLETKRMRLGRFIGLRGCESPFEVQVQTMEEIREDVRRERERGDEVEEVRRKMGGY